METAKRFNSSSSITAPLGADMRQRYSPLQTCKNGKTFMVIGRAVVKRIRKKGQLPEYQASGHGEEMGEWEAIAHLE